MSDLYVYVASAVVVAISVYFFARPGVNEADKAFEARYKAMQEEKRRAAAAGSTGVKATTSLTGGSSAIVAKKPVVNGPLVTVFYGSQTGTAESFAKTLVSLGNDQKYFAVDLVDLEEFEPSLLKTLEYVIFVVATYGEGDPTDNAVEFMKFLNDTDGHLADNEFDTVKFTVFGLGNKQYEQYNAIGRAVDAQLAKHGAQRVFPLGEGDDDGSLEEDFDAWKEKLWSTLRRADGYLETSDEEGDVKASKTKAPHLAFDVVPVAAAAASATAKPIPDDLIQNSTKHFFHNTEAKLVETRQLRQSTASGSTLHLEFDIKHAGVTYATADNLAILPENDPALVTRVATALRFDEDGVVELKALDKATKLPFPTPATIRTILSQYLDLNAAPRKGALTALAHYATSSVDQDRLLRLASADGKAEYQTWVVDAHRTFGDVIEAFPSLQIPLVAFIHILPSLQPRYYTISSSSVVHPTRIHVTLGVIATSDLPEGRQFKGVTSNYLAKLALPDAAVLDKPKVANPYGEQGKKQVRTWPSIRMTIRKSTFKLPPSPETPVILVGPGTGIAPMRAFLQERHAQKQAGETVGATWLFFGCRRQSEDYLYQQELETYQASGTLSDLHVAFSRDSAQKVYVQHLIRQQGAALWKVLAAGGYVYVCGATLMGTDVHKAFVELVQTHGAKSVVDATRYVQDLQHNHRYIQELWSA
ncbi:hypothetical protein H257_01459 [Aphanomyces astaci]|uniref:NADPH--hemoprotein reductase n=3 Tax=Aphanomyces astaci TaxID=112090 RepID=W4HAI2_APHAT|nr:hypothetical protein H257_01459 [Aphanomyces astaci]ETV88103.1 hypothetical protein H257_01459 [Aphanomyces astaci]|eukprot:XP_009822966.1 hypothetical protein H257_01459 [Aphanomyces astaci]